MSRTKAIPGAPKAQPWHPADWDLADAYAIQALVRGDCPPHLQQRAIKFIVENLACSYDMSFRAGKPDETAFAEGKRWVGLQIVKLMKVNTSTFRDVD